MANTSNGKPRYPHRPPSVMAGEAGHLGPAMRPQDIFVLIRRASDLRDDHEVVEVLRLGAAAIHDQPSLVPDLSDADRDTAITQAGDATPSRVMAWRKRAREMTWLELRVLLIGLAREAQSDA